MKNEYIELIGKTINVGEVQKLHREVMMARRRRFFGAILGGLIVTILLIVLANIGGEEPPVSGFSYPSQSAWLQTIPK